MTMTMPTRDTTRDTDVRPTDDDAEAARWAVDASLAAPEPLSGPEIVRRFPRLNGEPRGDTWGRKWARRAREQRAAGGAPPSYPTPITDTRRALLEAVPAAASSAPAGPARILNDTPRPTSQRAGQRSQRGGQLASSALNGLLGGTSTVLAALAVVLAAFACVTGAAAVMSYSHIRDLATHVGIGYAAWVAVPIDGMVMACSGALLVYWLCGVTGRHAVVAWVGLVVGLAFSLAANAVAVDPELLPERWVRLALAIYPPLALGVGAEAMLRSFGTVLRTIGTAGGKRRG